METWGGIPENHEQHRNENEGWPTAWIWIWKALLYHTTLDQSLELSDSICKMGGSWLRSILEAHIKTYSSWHILHAL